MQALKTFSAANAAVCRLCQKSTVCFSTAQQIHVRAAAGPASVMAIRSTKNWARVGKHLNDKAARPCQGKKHSFQGKKHSFQAPDAREFTDMHLKIRRFAQVGHAKLHIAASRLIRAHSRPPRPRMCYTLLYFKKSTGITVLSFQRFPFVSIWASS